MKRVWLPAFPIIRVAAEGSGFAQESIFHRNSILNSRESFTASIPPSGDLNPYRMAFVPAGFPSGGATGAADVLVANFNNSGNLQGSGTAIVSISPTGQQPYSLHRAGHTALGVISGGFVIVGNLPLSHPPPPGDASTRDAPVI